MEKTLGGAWELLWGTSDIGILRLFSRIVRVRNSFSHSLIQIQFNEINLAR